MTQKAKLLRERIPILQARVALLDEFLSLGLKKVDVSKASGVALPHVSAYFSGRSDNPSVEQTVKAMIARAREVQDEKTQVSA